MLGYFNLAIKRKSYKNLNSLQQVLSFLKQPIMWLFSELYLATIFSLKCQNFADVQISAILDINSSMTKVCRAKTTKYFLSVSPVSISEAS